MSPPSQAEREPLPKAYAYATRPRDGSRELLVFEHRDHDAGVQVPGGTVEDETPLDAAVRELAEEAGVTDVGAVERVGTSRWRLPDDGPVHERTFYHVETTEQRDRWTHTVRAGEEDTGLAFECYWVLLPDAALDHEMGALLDDIRE